MRTKKRKKINVKILLEFDVLKHKRAEKRTCPDYEFICCLTIANDLSPHDE